MQPILPGLDAKPQIVETHPSTELLQKAEVGQSAVDLALEKSIL